MIMLAGREGPCGHGPDQDVRIGHGNRVHDLRRQFDQCRDDERQQHAQDHIDARIRCKDDPPTSPPVVGSKSGRLVQTLNAPWRVGQPFYPDRQHKDDNGKEADQVRHASRRTHACGQGRRRIRRQHQHQKAYGRIGKVQANVRWRPPIWGHHLGRFGRGDPVFRNQRQTYDGHREGPESGCGSAGGRREIRGSKGRQCCIRRR